MMEIQTYPASVAIIGGDRRMLHTAAALEADGCSVALWGQNGEGEESAWADAIWAAEIVILPIPLTRDGEHLNAMTNPPRLCAIAERLRRGQRVALGNAPEWFVAALRNKGCAVLDYGKVEAYAIANARATAEGAIALAITHSPSLLLGASVAILGLGRIGKQLCRLLIALGAKVTVYARREADLAYARTMGAEAVRWAERGEEWARQSLLFNTVPETVWSTADFARLSADAILLDLAPVYEGTEDRRIIRCPALPYRFSPKSAGELIYTCIRDVTRKEEWTV